MATSASPRLCRLSPTASGAPPAIVVRDLKNKQHILYAWFVLAGALGILACIRLLQYLQNNIFVRRVMNATVTTFRIVFFRWTLRLAPSCVLLISEMAFIFGYITLNLVLLFVDTMHLLPSMFQGRAADLASSQLVLVVALASKNNIISMLTGISYEKLNVLHRAAGRTLFIMLWIHAIQRTLSGLPAKFDFSHDWMRTGTTSLAALTLTVILSVAPIRHAAFEFFLVVHIVLILIFLICGYHHVKVLHHGSLIYPALIVWALDRFLRLCRIFWNNAMWTSTHTKDASIEALSDDTVRLTLRRRGVTWRPGQHAYIILPTISKLPFEAHPFTIANIPEVVNEQKERELVFLIRGRTGFTRRLLQHALEGPKSVPALLDGPYGCPPNLYTFSTCILIAGGSGISYTLPLLQDLVRAHKNGDKMSVRRTVFVWALRDSNRLGWVNEEMVNALAGLHPSLGVEAMIYLTRSSNKTPCISELAKVQETQVPDVCKTERGRDDNQDTLVYHTFKVSHGRPIIKQLLHQELELAMGPVSVDVAGPFTLVREVRRALCTGLASPISALKGTYPVTLHVETFGTTSK